MLGWGTAIRALPNDAFHTHLFLVASVVLFLSNRFLEKVELLHNSPNYITGVMEIVQIFALLFFVTIW